MAIDFSLIIALFAVIQWHVKLNWLFEWLTVIHLQHCNHRTTVSYDCNDSGCVDCIIDMIEVCTDIVDCIVNSTIAFWFHDDSNHLWYDMSSMIISVYVLWICKCCNCKTWWWSMTTTCQYCLRIKFNFNLFGFISSPFTMIGLNNVDDTKEARCEAGSTNINSLWYLFSFIFFF